MVVSLLSLRTSTRFQERGFIEMVKNKEIEAYSVAEIMEILPSMTNDYNDCLNEKLTLKPEILNALNEAIKQACSRLIVLMS